MELSQVQETPPGIAIMGPAGAGKSALAMTLGRRVRLFDFDKGWIVGKKLIDQFTPRRLEVQIMGPVDVKGQPQGYADPNPTAPTGWMTFKIDLIAQLNWYAGRPDQGIVWCFDSLTSMFGCALRSILAAGGGWNRSTEQQHWHLAFTEIINMMDIIKVLPGIRILIAHDQRDEIKRDKRDPDPKTIIELGIPGKNMPGKLATYFDEFWKLDVELAAANQFKRLLRTVKDHMTPLKTRYQLPDGTDSAIGMEAILQKIGYKFPTPYPEPIKVQVPTPPIAPVQVAGTTVGTIQNPQLPATIPLASVVKK